MIIKCEKDEEQTTKDVVKAKLKLKEQLGKILVSKDGVEAVISSNTVGKMTHGLDNTIKNGFAAKQHYEVVAKIDEIYPNALKVLEHNSRKEGDIARIIRLGAPIDNIDGGVAYITVREAINSGTKRRVHAIELMEIERLGEHLEAAENNPTNFPSPILYPNNIRYLQAKVKSKTKKM